MRVESNSEMFGVKKAHVQHQAFNQPRPAQDSLALTHSESLDRALEKTPDTRPEAVERAKALLRDSSYPSNAKLRDLADLLASRMDPQKEA